MVEPPKKNSADREATRPRPLNQLPLIRFPYIWLWVPKFYRVSVQDPSLSDAVWVGWSRLPKSSRSDACVCVCVCAKKRRRRRFLVGIYTIDQSRAAACPCVWILLPKRQYHNTSYTNALCYTAHTIHARIYWGHLIWVETKTRWCSERKTIQPDKPKTTNTTDLIDPDLDISIILQKGTSQAFNNGVIIL